MTQHMTLGIYTNCIEKKKKTIDKIYFISYRYRNTIPI